MPLLLENKVLGQADWLRKRGMRYQACQPVFNPWSHKEDRDSALSCPVCSSMSTKTHGFILQCLTFAEQSDPRFARMAQRVKALATIKLGELTNSQKLFFDFQRHIHLCTYTDTHTLFFKVF